MIIGFTGKKSSGKTTAAKYLVDNHDFIKIGFKDAMIKEMRGNLQHTLNAIADVYQINVNDLFETKPPIMRRLMQEYGTEVRRGDNQDYWIKKFVQNLPNNSEFPLICVDDVRFLNEAEIIKTLGGMVIRIELYDTQAQSDGHVSETEMDMIQADKMFVNKLGEQDILGRQIDEWLVKNNII